MEYLTLANGVEMPILGLGVFKTAEMDDMREAVRSALESGYRLFDTAQMYKNEDMLGAALQECHADRKSIFITSKVDRPLMGYESTIASFKDSLARLKTDYLDLFLVHWPGQQKVRLQQTWKALEDLYKAGKVRAIGVCNSLPKHIQWIDEIATVKPMLNQIEHHPGYMQNELVDYTQSAGMACQAWAPLNKGSFDFPILTQIGEKYGKTPAQVILRWDIQHHVAVIPKSVHRERIFQNIDVFDFSLAKEDMDAIDAIKDGVSSAHDLGTYDF